MVEDCGEYMTCSRLFENLLINHFCKTELKSQIDMLLRNHSNFSSAMMADLENFLKQVPGFLSDASGSTSHEKEKTQQTDL